ncbi:MAG: hypothetical protein BLITH_1583 [Brockia lithotrophica]|uniref:Uncharacterized protein n=1 Tax=Brockia lithotrophica TaxID=933949 RepID=A0A2T5G5P5_9BACL|nr:MAG: hypothetical protein BLITH_1583 [Brockia lithotrophica]
MMSIKVIKYVLKDYYRTLISKVEQKIEKFAPEFKSASKIIVTFRLIVGIMVVMLPFLINITEINILSYFIRKYFLCVAIILSTLSIVILLSILDYNIKEQYKDLFGYGTMALYVLINYKEGFIFFNWLLIQTILASIFKLVYLFLILPINLIGLLLIIKMALFNHPKKEMFKKIIYSILGLEIIYVLITLLIDKPHNISTYLTAFNYYNQENIFSIFILLLFIITWNSFVPKLTSFKKIIYDPFKLSKKENVFLIPWKLIIHIFIIMLVTNIFIELKKYIFNFIVFSYFYNSQLTKLKYINLTSFESFGPFLYYIKKLDNKIGQKILRNIQLNNYIILLPSILFYIIFTISIGNIYYSIILVLLFILDLELDYLILLIFPKVLDKSELNNLRFHTVKGITSATLAGIGLTSPLIYLINKNKNLNLQVNLLYIDNNFKLVVVIVLLLTLITILIKEVWIKSFFDDLYK